jgi:hypothetical protein
MLIIIKKEYMILMFYNQFYNIFNILNFINFDFAFQKYENILC